MHQAGMTLIVCRCKMLHQSVVPDRHRTRFPAKPTGKSGLRTITIKIIQKWATFFNRPAVKTDSEVPVYKKRFLSRLRMTNDRRMTDFSFEGIGANTVDDGLRKTVIGMNRVQSLQGV